MRPLDFHLRRATAEDAKAIRRLIRRVRINPMGLDWHRFVLAVDQAGNVLGCGQIKPHRGGVLELASIAVEPVQQGQGIARAVIEDLLGTARRPLFLTCRSSLADFYGRWGFEPASLDTMPGYFRRLSGLAAFFMRGGRHAESLLVMVLK